VLSSFGVHCLLNAGLLILQMDYNNDLLCRMARPQLMILLVFLASGFANSEGFVPQAPSVRALPIFFAPGSNSHLAHRVSTSHQKVGSGQIAPPASVQRTESVTMLKLSEGSGADVEVIVPKNVRFRLWHGLHSLLPWFLNPAFFR